MIRRAPALASLISLTLALAAWSLPAQAQWKWKDAKGQVQYSDIPPPGSVPEKDILQRPTVNSPARVAPPVVAASAAASAPLGVDPQLEAKRKQAEEQETAKRNADKKAEEEKLAAVRADNCGKARANLRLLEDGGRIQRADAQGNREFLDDAARSKEMAAARQTIASECR